MLNKIDRTISVRFLWCMAVLSGIFIFVNTQPIRPHDFWWHLAVGRDILTTHQIPMMDVYSYTMAGQPYPSYSMYWFIDTWLYLVYKWGGPALIIFFHSLVITTAYGLVALICWQISRRWGVVTVAMLFAAAVGVHNWNVRPQAISYLIGAVYLYAIYACRRHPHPAWLVVFPLGMLVWVNSHGSFPIGILLIGLWLADEAWQIILTYRSIKWKQNLKRLILPGSALLLAGLACLVNPRGFGIFDYLLSMVGSSVIQKMIPEWAAPTFDSQYGAIFLIALLLSVTVLVLSPKRPNFFQVTTFLVFALLSLKTMRGVIWFGLCIAPVLADHLTSIAAQLDRKKISRSPNKVRPLLNLFFLILLIAMTFISIPWFKSWLPFPALKAGLISIETPISATQFLLKIKSNGRIFNELSFGSYLIWVAQPDFPVFVDTRLDLYPAKIWQDYLHISNALPDWEDRLVGYGVQTLMLSPTDQEPLIEAVENSSNWQLRYRDPTALIFSRIP